MGTAEVYFSKYNLEIAYSVEKGTGRGRNARGWYPDLVEI
jgi:hypothetical protein